MTFWTAAVIIVVVITLSGIYRSRLKVNAEKSEGFFEDLLQRIARLEDRMANSETIVLEKERTKAFNKI